MIINYSLLERRRWKLLLRQNSMMVSFIHAPYSILSDRGEFFHLIPVIIRLFYLRELAHGTRYRILLSSRIFLYQKLGFNIEVSEFLVQFVLFG